MNEQTETLAVGTPVRIQFHNYDDTKPEHRAYQGRVGEIQEYWRGNYDYAVRSGRVIIGADRVDLVPVAILSAPADWEPPAFMLGQQVFVRDSGNLALIVIGLEYVSPRLHTLGPWWKYQLGKPETLAAIGGMRDEEDLSATPLVAEDLEWLAYVRKGGTLPWYAWRQLSDDWERIPLDEPAYAQVKAELLIEVEDPE